MNIVHNIYDLKSGFLHSVTVDDVEGDRVSYREIAVGPKKEAYGTTDYWGDTLPRLFTATEWRYRDNYITDLEVE